MQQKARSLSCRHLHPLLCTQLCVLGSVPAQEVRGCPPHLQKHFPGRIGGCWVHSELAAWQGQKPKLRRQEKGSCLLLSPPIYSGGGKQLLCLFETLRLPCNENPAEGRWLQHGSPRHQPNSAEGKVFCVFPSSNFSGQQTMRLTCSPGIYSSRPDKITRHRIYSFRMSSQWGTAED